MSVLLKLSKSSKKRFENNSVVITQKTSKGILFFIQSNISKIDRLRGERKEMVKWINTSTSSVRVVKKPEQHAHRGCRSTHWRCTGYHRRNSASTHCRHRSP